MCVVDVDILVGVRQDEVQMALNFSLAYDFSVHKPSKFSSLLVEPCLFFRRCRQLPSLIVFFGFSKLTILSHAIEQLLVPIFLVLPHTFIFGKFRNLLKFQSL